MPTRRRRKAAVLPPEHAAVVVAPTASPTHADIARRAYELFIQRGSEDGRDQDDWLSAESELLSVATVSPSREGL